MSKIETWLAAANVLIWVAIVACMANGYWAYTREEKTRNNKKKGSKE